MKIVVIDGTGLIGSKIVPMLRQDGHEVAAASPRTGINTIVGEGLEEAMAGPGRDLAMDGCRRITPLAAGEVTHALLLVGALEVEGGTLARDWTAQLPSWRTSDRLPLRPRGHRAVAALVHVSQPHRVPHPQGAAVGLLQAGVPRRLTVSDTHVILRP